MSLTVLIVDDELLARTRLRTLLGDCTAPVVQVVAEAANAAQALAWLQHQTVDVALIDIHMPGADGLTLAQTLRTLPQQPAVVFVTADAGHAVQAFELEALDYLTKPVRLERLQAMLQKVKRLTKVIRGLEPDFPEEVLLIQERGRTERVPLSKVLYLKAELKYITVRTLAKSYLLEGR
jgi:two-component system response regulator AlgR